VERTNPLDIGRFEKKIKSHHYQLMWLSLVVMALTINNLDDYDNDDR
jgi:hypothetical protein